MAQETTFMMEQKRLTLDANILLRGVFGIRVLSLLETYEDGISFNAPDVCFEEALKYIPEIAARRNMDAGSAYAILNQLERIVQVVDRGLYKSYEQVARKRIASRDNDDWPIVATSLLLDCPIWTEDQDFFGSGVATWTTANVELYLQQP